MVTKKKPDDFDWPLTKRMVAMLCYLSVAASCDGDREAMATWSDLFAGHAVDLIRKDLAAARERFKIAVKTPSTDQVLSVLDAIENALPTVFAGIRGGFLAKLQRVVSVARKPPSKEAN